MYRNFVLLVLCLISFVSFTFWPASAQTASKIGVVDGDKIFEQYPGVQDAQKKIADLQDALKDSVSESEKIYSEFEKQKKSETEKLTKKKELQAKIDTKAQETKKMIESISKKIEDDILQAIKKVSAEKGLDVVMDKRAVLSGGTDVTDLVSEQLKKKPPIANGDSQTSPSLEKSEKKTN